MSEIDWNGEGLPPVGTVCEFLRFDKDDEQYVYSQCKILAHDDDQSIVFRVTSGPELGNLHAKYAVDFDKGLPMFRPIRTPEQIAAEEREKELEAMEEIAARAWRSVAPGEDMVSVIVSALHSDGYRKQEPKP